MPCQEETPIENKHLVEGVLENFITFLHNQETEQNETTTIRTFCDAIPLDATAVSSNTIYSYINYRKTVDNKLAEINNNISDMLVESFKGIDIICSKVRECVSDFNQQETRHSPIEASLDSSIEQISSTLDDNATENDFATENLLESIEEDTEKTLKSSDEEEETTLSETGSAYIIENLLIVEETPKETVNKQEEPDLLKAICDEISKPYVPSSMTVVGDGDINTVNDKTPPPLEQQQQPQKQEEQVTKINKKIEKRNKQKYLLENLRDTLKKDVDNTDVESLQMLIENVTKRIDILSSQSTGEEHKESKKEFRMINSKGAKTPPTPPYKDQEDTDSPPPDVSISRTKTMVHNPPQYADVYHRPAFTNLHKKLLWQLEANDSFVTFQKLMCKHRQQLNCGSPITNINIPLLSNSPSLCFQKNKRSTRNNLSKTSIKSTLQKSKTDESPKKEPRPKYGDSLWFPDKKAHRNLKSPKKKKWDKNNKEKHKTINKLRKGQRSAVSIHQKVPSSKSISACRCPVTVTNDSPAPFRNTRIHWNYHRNSNRKLAYLDILDDLTNKDLLPLHSEYPRKDRSHVLSKKNDKNVHDSYLYKMMYGVKEKSPTVWNHLLQPTIICSDQSCSICDHEKHKDESFKLERLCKSSRDDNRNKPLSADKSTVVNARKKREIQTLARHMFDPQPEDHRKNCQTLIVMPVRVFYDRDQNVTSSIPLNSNHPKDFTVTNRKKPIPLPLMPMKEVKVNRAKWTCLTVKKIPQCFPTGTVTHSEQNVNNNKPVVKKFSARASCAEKSESNRYENKYEFPKQQNSSYDSKDFKVFCDNSDDIQEAQKRVSRNMGKFPQRPPKFENKSKTFKTGMNSQKPSNKCEKTIAQQLVSYFKNQPEKLEEGQTSTDKRSNVLPTKTKPEVKISHLETPKHPLDSGSSTNLTATRHKQMLLHLKGLKQTNNKIQNNIQQAIDVIEAKMVDLLSSSGDSANLEAFNAMEKEITNVLDLMKHESDSQLSPVREQSPLSTVRERSVKISTIDKTDIDKTHHLKVTETLSALDMDPEETPEQSPFVSEKQFDVVLMDDIDAISSDLFKKLDKILEPEINEESSTSDEDTENELVKLASKRTPTFFSSSDTTISTDDISHIRHKKERMSVIKSHVSIKERTKKKLGNKRLLPNVVENKCNMGESSLVQNQIDLPKLSEECDKSHGDGVPISKRSASRSKEDLRYEDKKYEVGPVHVNTSIIESGLKMPNPSKPRNKGTLLSKQDLIEIAENEDTVPVLTSEMNTSSTPTSIEKEKPSTLDHINVPLLCICKENDEKCCLKREESIKCNQERLEPLEHPLTDTILFNEASSCQKNIKDLPTMTYFRESQEILDKLNSPSNLDLGRIRSISSPNLQRLSGNKYETEVQNLISNTNKLEIDKEDKVTAPHTIELDEETNFSDNLEDQVNKIISRVEDIYNQLDEIQISTKEDFAIPVFREFSTDLDRAPSQEFLTPFMQAVKYSRGASKSQGSNNSLVSLEKSPSYYNVLNFLDNLSDIQTEIAIEVHRVNYIYYSYRVYTATVVHLISIEHYACLTDESSTQLTKKPSCLKKRSEDVKTKPKKVSFLFVNQPNILPAPNVEEKEGTPVIVPPSETDVDQSYVDKTIPTQLHDEKCCHTTNSGNKSIVVICANRNKSDVSTEMNPTESITSVGNTLGNKSTQIDLVQKSTLQDVLVGNSDGMLTSDELSESSSNLSLITAQSAPKIKVFYNLENKSPQIFCDDDNNNVKRFYNTKSVWKGSRGTQATTQNKPNVVIFREISNYTPILERPKSLEEIVDTAVLPAIKNDVSEENNVVLLKSFYALVYILMFTALNMEYRCF